jgi:hypothetical protein
MQPIVPNDDVGHRPLETAGPFQDQVAAPIATQDYPFPVTDVYASDDNSQSGESISVSDDVRSTR